MLKTKIVSSQEKIFVDDKLSSFAPVTTLTALGGELTAHGVLVYANTHRGNLKGNSDYSVSIIVNFSKIYYNMRKYDIISSNILLERYAIQIHRLYRQKF